MFFSFLLRAATWGCNFTRRFTPTRILKSCCKGILRVTRLLFAVTIKGSKEITSALISLDIKA
jgi:hypothetical protein